MGTYCYVEWRLAGFNEGFGRCQSEGRVEFPGCFVRVDLGAKRVELAEVRGTVTEGVTEPLDCRKFLCMVEVWEAGTNEGAVFVENGRLEGGDEFLAEGGGFEHEGLDFGGGEGELHIAMWFWRWRWVNERVFEKADESLKPLINRSDF